jgi:starch phosphorylase
MSTTQMSVLPKPTESMTRARLRTQYGCGPIEFAGTDHALYERHLLFDDVNHPAMAGSRERFDARSLGAGHSLPVLGAHRRHLHQRQPQARLLSLDGISGGGARWQTM